MHNILYRRDCSRGNGYMEKPIEKPEIAITRAELKRQKRIKEETVVDIDYHHSYWGYKHDRFKIWNHDTSAWGLIKRLAARNRYRVRCLHLIKVRIYKTETVV